LPIRIPPLSPKNSQKTAPVLRPSNAYWQQNGNRIGNTKEATVTMTDNAAEGVDLLYGVPAIADYLGISKRTAYHLVETHRIPFFRIGKILCARRSKLLAAMDRLEAQSTVG
jgi:excisionase family DNA binding protein